MEIITRREVPENKLLGGFMQKAVGRSGDDYFSNSSIFNIDYCRYCAEAGPMEPHMHAEETVQILDTDRAFARFGVEKRHLPNKIYLQKDITLDIPEREWYIFEYDEESSLEILFKYGNRIAL